MKDKSESTKYEVPSSDFANQYIEYDWSGCGDNALAKIESVLLETDESQMTSGTVKFYVDDVECSDSVNGVGTGGKGGVFNCGLTGTRFVARCTSACTPNFSVVELKLWKKEVVSLQGSIE